MYRDAYTPILAECPANQYGASIPSNRRTAIVALDNIHDGDWALYAGVEFGNSEYSRKPDSIAITASCASSGGVVEVWFDSLDSKSKIAECGISNTGSWDTFNTFTAKILTPVSGNHDVYLKFRGSGSDKLFMLQWFTFVGITSPASSVGESKSGEVPDKFSLGQNFPNPFNPTTAISYQLPAPSGAEGSAFSHVTLRICDLLGREIVTLVNNEQAAGRYTAQWDGRNKNGEELSSGVYLYQLRAGDYVSTKKMILMK